MGGILHFLKWLLSEDSEEAQIRRGLILITIPIIEVDTYISNREPGDEKTWNKGEVPIYNLNAWTWECFCELGLETGILGVLPRGYPNNLVESRDSLLLSA